MTDKHSDHDAYHDCIDALISGARDPAPPATRHSPTREQAEAYHRAMSLLAREHAPRRLQEKLLQAARNEQPTPGDRPWLRPALAAAAAVLVALFIGLHDGGDPQAREIARGKQELAFALAQIDRATSLTREQVKHRIRTNVQRPVADRFVTVIGEQLDLNEE